METSADLWCSPNALVRPDGQDLSISLTQLGNPFERTGWFGRLGETLADAHHAAVSWPLTTGSTGAHDLVASTIRRECGRGIVLIDRGSHHSVAMSCIRAGLVPVLLPPTFGITDGLAPLAQAALNAGIERVRSHRWWGEDLPLLAISYPSPTYDGARADHRMLVDCAHAAGALVWVDEAWGAHGRLLWPGETAMDGGADIAVQSLHKMAGALCPASQVLYADTRWLKPSQRVYRMMATTSPSYPVYTSIERAHRQLTDDVISDACARATDLVDTVEQAHRTDDPLKVIVRPVDQPDRVRTDFEHRGMVVERAGDNHLLLIAQYRPQPGAQERMIAALSQLPTADNPVQHIPFISRTDFPTMSPTQAWMAQSKAINHRDVDRHVSTDCIEVYPPGVPLCLPGWRLDPQLIAWAQEHGHRGAQVTGMDEYVWVVDEQQNELVKNIMD